MISPISGSDGGGEERPLAESASRGGSFESSRRVLLYCGMAVLAFLGMVGVVSTLEKKVPPAAVRGPVLEAAGRGDFDADGLHYPALGVFWIGGVGRLHLKRGRV